ncbi:acyl-CoA N-acyltransferase [Dichotomopilus funicola]|uniref:Acyl-CoA N-acyltransferase n=1 Tax=Dichotomopilus funicola TaxID=1934379 RepID=A0AAN6VA54_9PEZI|nr:acyl-CoA N-acyltransferase [Dichotomopilus funicola]
MPHNTPPLTIRRATPADLPALHKLVESAYRGDSSRLGWTTETDMLGGQRIPATDLLAKINNPTGIVWLASSTEADLTTNTSERETKSGTEKDRQPKDTDQDQNQDSPLVLLGCCELTRLNNPSTTTTPRTAFFGLFAVSPTHQSLGIGHALLSHAEAYAQQTWDTQRMEMVVTMGRPELVAWYVRRGYVETGEERVIPMEELERQGSVVLVEGIRFGVLVKGLGGGK